jgi:hypothetical protein
MRPGDARTGPLDMLPPSSLVLSPGRLIRSSLDQSKRARTFFTRPTLRHSFLPTRPTDASNRFPSDVRFAQASTDYINGPSKLACCLPGTARMSFLLRPWREHSLDFAIRLVPRARSGSTGTICVSCPPSWCVRSASTGDQQTLTPLFRPATPGAQER